MTEYETRVISLVVKPVKEPNFSELATTISIDSEGSGEFITIKQQGRNDENVVGIDPCEWPLIKEAVERLLADCREG